MMVNVNANEISNETIMKLTAKEIGKLGLVNCGVYTYHGELKSRIKGIKRILNTEVEIHFENEMVRVEFIKIQDSGRFENAEYAMRVWNKNKEEYMESYQILFGCDFFRN